VITEDQARTLFRGEPAGAIDAYAVLRAGQSARRRRRAAFGVAVSGVTAAAVVVATGGRPPAEVVAPTASRPPSPAPAPVRLDPAQVGNVVRLANYTDRGTRLHAVAYFVRRGSSLAVCTASLGGAAPVPHGCTSPVAPGVTHIGMVSRDPGSVGTDGPATGPSTFGKNLWYAVVSTEVAGGWFVDETGMRHDAEVYGADDPTLPARVMVADLRGHVFRSIGVVDAGGRVLSNDATRAVRADANAVGNPVVVAGYEEGRDHRDVYAYFARMAQTGDDVVLCMSAVGPRDVKDLGCNGPALPGPPGPRDVGIAGHLPGATEDGPRSTYGPLGKGWTLTVVSTRVARGVVVDDRGGRHEGTIYGAEDTTLPARFLVARTGDRWFRSVEVYDADGRRLPQ
jgi:hypothetical protein